MSKLNDGIVSANNSLGERSQARTYTRNRKLNDNLLATLYDDNWIVKKFINGITTDMLRIDREIKTDLESGIDKKIEQFCLSFGVFDALEDYLNWGRLYGDSIILAVTERMDGGEVNMQGHLDLDQERLVSFLVFDKSSYLPSSTVITDISSRNFGEPVSYQLTIGDEQVIHHSRVCRLVCGKKTVKKKLKGGRQSYGVSEVNSIWDALVAYDTAKAGISDMIEEAKTDVIKIKDYNIKMAEGREADFVKLGVSMKLVKSLANVLMIDQDAEWEQKEMAFTGITGVLADARIDVSASTGIPLMEMFGQGAGGFASGEEDKKNKYEMINAKQESQLRPAWNFIDQFMIDKFKEEDEAFKLEFFDYDFPSIRDRNEKEEAEIAKIIIDSLKVLYDMDAVDAVQAASEVKLKGLIASISDADIEALKAVINDPAYEKNTGGFSF